MYSSRKFKIILIVIILLLLTALFYLAKYSQIGTMPIIYNKFESSENGFNQIVFDYPADWVWNYSDYPTTIKERRVSILDPDKPEGSLDFRPNLDRGIISISVLEIKTGEFSTERYIDEQVDMMIGNPYIELSIDEFYEVNDYEARRIIMFIAPRPEPMNQLRLIDESVFVLAGSKFYDISITLPESERFGSLGQAFDHLIETLHFVP